MFLVVKFSFLVATDTFWSLPEKYSIHSPNRKAPTNQIFTDDDVLKAEFTVKKLTLRVAFKKKTETQKNYPFK